MNTLYEMDVGMILQSILAILITIGCFVSYFMFQATPEWAVQLLVLVFGFFFGSRYGATQERKTNGRTNKNES